MLSPYINSESDLLLKNFKQLYRNFGLHSIDDLGKIYTQDVEFIDPSHHIHGLLGLKRHFRHQAANLNSCRFRYISELQGEDKAFIRWEMDFSHPKINKGKTLVVPGMTEIHFSRKIFYHHDSFDLGAMVYEHLPVIGSAVKQIKRKLSDA